jgi:UDP-glucuronate 4-epimerase
MKILITGVAGFIGFSLAKELLKKNYLVYGIDNMD